MTEGPAAEEEDEDVESGPAPTTVPGTAVAEEEGGAVAEEGETRRRMV